MNFSFLSNYKSVDNRKKRPRLLTGWKSKMPKIARFLIIFLLIAGWVFAGWPPVLSFAQEAASTLQTQTAPIKIVIDNQNGAKIDNQSLPFALPNGSGDLELYALPDQCLGATISEIKRNLLTPPYCGDPIGFVLSRPQDYFWDFSQPTRVVIGFCGRQDIDCEENPDQFQIVFISDPLVPAPNQVINTHQTNQIQF